MMTDSDRGAWQVWRVKTKAETQQELAEEMGRREGGGWRPWN